MTNRVPSSRISQLRLSLLLFFIAGVLVTGIAVWAGIVPAKPGLTSFVQTTETTLMNTNSVHPLDGKWIITQASDVSMRDDHEMYLEVTEGAVYGIGPCNDFNTRAMTTGGELGFMPIEIGGESCASGSMREEQDFIQNLKRVSRYEISGDELVMYMIDTEALRARKVR
jgi:heat shock protein HslJ